VIARSRRIRLSNGIEFDTPLLVPALSSRATGPIPYARSPGSKPELTTCSIVHSDTLTNAIDEALLISAYDIRHGLIADSETLKSGFADSRYAKPLVLIIDSGWYEKRGDPLGGPFVEGLDDAKPWEEADYQMTIDGLDDEVRAIVVSWDHSGSYGEQIDRAQDFFGARRRFASTILLKPPGESRFHDLGKLSGEDVANLRGFGIVGVTEKELADALLDRLKTLARLRRLLDEEEVQAPIHVFGGLDPLVTPLYFAAGGEVFDGLGWLRYAYREGVAMSRESATILDGQVSKRWFQALTFVSLQNLDVIRNLTDELRVFAHSQGDWSKVSTRGAVFKTICDRLDEKVGD